MIASAIGKRFLKVYNEKFHTNYSAKQFFEKIYYPLFFDHPKYMMTAGNSPLENPKISWDEMIRGKKPYETEEKRNERFVKLISKIENNEPEMSIAIGYPSLDLMATTSCQISNLKLPITKEDVYLSWIGHSLGIGVGALTILFDKPQIGLDLFAGWLIYRELLEATPSLKGNQINTWNGQWLAHRYGRMYVEDDPTANFNPFSTKDGLMSVDTQSWTKVLIAISMRFSDLQSTGYVYNIGQMNTTVGFIPFILKQIRCPVELYQKFFGMEDGYKAEQLYGTAFTFSKACQVGSIGVKALEPKGMREYLVNGKLPKYEKESDEKRISFNTYQIWILAMLNNEDLWVKAQELANELHLYEQGAVQAKSDRKNKVKTVLQSTRKSNFIENLVPIVSEIENKTIFESIASLVNLMPTDNVPYFLTLVRFQYAIIQ